MEAHETYPVLAGARHAVLEPERARAFQAALEGGPEKAGVSARVQWGALHASGPQGLDERLLWDAQALGDVLSECHASYGALGLGCEGADVLAELVKEAPGSDGGPGVLVGCRITGGGCGGTVCVAACGDEADVVAGLAWLADEYLCRTGIQARVLRCGGQGRRRTPRAPQSCCLGMFPHKPQQFRNSQGHESGSRPNGHRSHQRAVSRISDGGEGGVRGTVIG